MYCDMVMHTHEFYIRRNMRNNGYEIMNLLHNHKENIATYCMNNSDLSLKLTI